MRWIKPGLRNTLSAMLGGQERTDSPESLEPVRNAMLQALGEDGAKLNPHLHRRLQYLHDAHALWYARADMVAVLSRIHGEAHAVRTVQRLSPAFKGLLPKSLTDATRARR